MAAALGRKHADGSTASRKPGGREIVAAMKRAVVLETGEIAWSEVCFCTPPLAHERATVYDLHFDDHTTEPVQGYQGHEGKAFMAYLWEVAD